MSNWILDFFKKIASDSEDKKETSVTINIDNIDVTDGNVTIKPKVKIKNNDIEEKEEKKAELSFQLGDLVNIKNDPENKAIYLEDQDSKPGDIDLLLYYLKPQIDGHHVIETPHVEVQLDKTRKATDEELTSAKTAFEMYKKDLQEYKDSFKKKEATVDDHDFDESSHDMSEKEMLAMTIQLLEEEISREHDQERLKMLKDDLEHSKMHLQTMASLKKEAGDIGFDSHNDAWYRVWVDEGDLRYDKKVEAIIKSDATDKEKEKLVIERAKEIADEHLRRIDQLASEDNLGVQFYHLWAGDVYSNRINWSEFLHPDTYETESSLKKKSAQDFTNTVIQFHDDEIFISDDFAKAHPESVSILKYYSTIVQHGVIGFPGAPLRGWNLKLKETWEFLENHVEELENFKTEKAEQISLEDVFKSKSKPEEVVTDEFDPKTLEVLSPAERRKRTDQLLDEYNTATPERKEYITRQLKELRASLNVNSLFKDWWKKYKNEPALKDAYKKYSAEVKDATLPVPEYKDWAREQYNELAGFTANAAEKDPSSEKNIAKAKDLLLKLISDGYKTDSLMNLFKYVSFKTGASPEAIMDIYDEFLYNGKLVEILDKVMVKSASLMKVSYIVRRKKGWYVLSEEGKNLGGPYPSKSKAKKRLQQVEYFKHKGELLKEFEIIARTSKTEEEAEALRTQLLELHADQEQYPLDVEIKELLDIINQLEANEEEIIAQIGAEKVLELHDIAKVFNNYLNPSDEFVPSRTVLQNIERANAILGL